MNPVRQRLLAMRAEIDALLEDLGDQPEPANATVPPTTAIWMKAPEYAQYRKMSRGTLRARILDGLPHTGSGHGLRINVAQADAFLARRG